jgi:thymidylate kinase
LCASNGVNAIVLQEPAELLPKCIPKGIVEQNLWITLRTLEEALTLSYSNNADYYLLDRGYYNQLFWASMYEDTNPEYAEYVKQLVEDFGKRFNTKPDYLYVIDVDVEEALRRRAASGEPVTFSKGDFLRNYREKFEKFTESINPKLYLDTTNMGKDEVAEAVFKQIITL